MNPVVIAATALRRAKVSQVVTKVGRIVLITVNLVDFSTSNTGGCVEHAVATTHCFQHYSTRPA